MGFLDKAQVLLDVIEPQTTLKGGDVCQEMVLWRMLSASCHGLMADRKGCLDGIDRVLAVADSSGMHVYDIFMLFYGALAGFIDYDQRVVDAYFERIAAAQGGAGLIHPIVYRQIMGWKYIMAGNHQIALEHVEAALELTRTQGAPIEISINAIVKAQVLFVLERRDEAHRCLDDVVTGTAAFSAYIRYMLRCTLAWFAFGEGDEATGMLHLREAMHLGSHQRILMHHFWTPRIMAMLCAKALECGIEPGYVRELITRHRLVPQNATAENANWPWPLRIHTLGRFVIERQGERLVFSGKKQEKPLSLLKALIVHGGVEVPAEWLCDVLWPSATGDAAYSSLKMALSRLRRLLGDDHLIEMREGKLTLNRDSCWVDAWAMTGITGRIDAVLNQRVRGDAVAHDDSQLVNLVDSAIRMYAGVFLYGEKTEYWEISFRNRLRHTFLGVLKKYCADLERAQRWDVALEYYRRAHEADNLAEEVYQRLMVCHHRLGQKAEAASVYKMCRTILLKVLSITPSHQTEEIYNSLK
jgi:DNA-binding SARP family transcriptional activator